MTPILTATENKGKAREISKIFAGSGYEAHFLFEYKDKLNGLEIQENAKSFEGNALIKAIVVGNELCMLTLADDSGLCVEALGGRPGVYSARYSEVGTEKANYLKVLDEMKGVPIERRACNYTCAVAIFDPSTKFVQSVFGVWEGRVALEPRGDKSFGYAPIFLAKEFDFGRTNAECDPQELIMINHRGKAFREAIRVLDGFFLK